MQLMVRGFAEPPARPFTIGRCLRGTPACVRARRGLHCGRPRPVFSVLVQQAVTQESKSASSAAPAPVPVKFSLRREVGFGQSHVVVGSVPGLGQWDTKSAAQMTWSEGHLWTAEVALPPGTSLEFKCVRMVFGQEGSQEWEGGENHVLTVPDSGVASLAVEVTWSGALDVKVVEAAAPPAAAAAKVAPPAPNPAPKKQVAPAAAAAAQAAARAEAAAPAAAAAAAPAAANATAAAAAPAAAPASEQKAAPAAAATAPAKAAAASPAVAGGEAEASAGPEALAMAVRTASLLVVLSAGLMVYSCNLTPNLCSAALGPPLHWRELGSVAAQGVGHLGEVAAKGLESLRSQGAQLGDAASEGIRKIGAKAQ